MDPNQIKNVLNLIREAEVRFTGGRDRHDFVLETLRNAGFSDEMISQADEMIPFLVEMARFVNIYKKSVFSCCF